jgi:hypothetical protein
MALVGGAVKAAVPVSEVVAAGVKPKIGALLPPSLVALAGASYVVALPVYGNRVVKPDAHHTQELATLRAASKHVRETLEVGEQFAKDMRKFERHVPRVYPRPHIRVVPLVSAIVGAVTAAVTVLYGLPKLLFAPKRCNPVPFFYPFCGGQYIWRDVETHSVTMGGQVATKCAEYVPEWVATRCQRYLPGPFTLKVALGAIVCVGSAVLCGRLMSCPVWTRTSAAIKKALYTTPVAPDILTQFKDLAAEHGFDLNLLAKACHEASFTDCSPASIRLVRASIDKQVSKLNVGVAEGIALTQNYLTVAFTKNPLIKDIVRVYSDDEHFGALRDQHKAAKGIYGRRSLAL